MRVWTRWLSIVLLGLTTACSSSETYLHVESRAGRGDLQVAWLDLEKPGAPDIKLINMVHLATPEYYEDVTQALNESSVVMMEGVHGKNRDLELLSQGYKKLAIHLGLKAQGDCIKKNQRWDYPDVHVDEVASALKDVNMRVTMLNSRLKREIEKRKRERERRGINETDEERLAAVQGDLRQTFAKALDSPSDPDALIILHRNDTLLSHLEKRIEEAKHPISDIAICYGVGHAEDLVLKLKSKGWVVSKTQWISLYDW